MSADHDHLLEVYQYFLNAADSLVEKLLFMYTFLSEAQIRQVMEEHAAVPEHRRGQRQLAMTVVRQLSGSEATATRIGNYGEYFKLDFQKLVR